MFVFTLLLAALLAEFFGKALTRAQFIQPPPRSKDSWQDNPRYHLGSTVDFAWKSDDATLKLLLFIEYPKPSLPSKCKGKRYWLKKNITSETTNFHWTTDLFGRELIVPPHDDAVSYLALADEASRTIKYYSSFFNISLTNNQSPSGRYDKLQDPAPLPESGLSAGATAGVAVGATIGTIVGAGLAWSLWRWRRIRMRSRQTLVRSEGYKPKSGRRTEPVHELAG